MFPGGKSRSMCTADIPYHLHVLIVLKFGSLNRLEPLGPVQACNGIALPLLALHVYLPRCMLEGCTYTTKVESTVSGFSTKKCEKYFYQYIKHGNYNW
jgi:hypothetical protein